MPAKLEPLIYIVDDDPSMLESLAWLITSTHIPVSTHLSAEEFLKNFNPDQHGCLLLDVRMPYMSGLELQAKLRAEIEMCLPIIFISGKADVLLAVQAMKEGAFDFLTKPFNDNVLLETINNALRLDKSFRHEQEKEEWTESKFSALSQRELQILKAIVEGKKNKVISGELNISLKTVESHRSSMIRKMGFRSVAELVAFALTHPLPKSPP